MIHVYYNIYKVCCCSGTDLYWPMLLHAYESNHKKQWFYKIHACLQRHYVISTYFTIKIHIKIIWPRFSKYFLNHSWPCKLAQTYVSFLQSGAISPFPFCVISLLLCCGFPFSLLCDQFIVMLWFPLVFRLSAVLFPSMLSLMSWLFGSATVNQEQKIKKEKPATAQPVHPVWNED